MTERYDAIVIGAGQAGPALCARLDREGLRTALIERKLLGGTCVNVGCIPTKTLVASARAASVARRGAAPSTASLRAKCAFLYPFGLALAADARLFCYPHSMRLNNPQLTLLSRSEPSAS